MLDVSEYINEVKRDSEQLQIINDIQASITDLRMPDGVGMILHKMSITTISGHKQI